MSRSISIVSSAPSEDITVYADLDSSEPYAIAGTFDDRSSRPPSFIERAFSKAKYLRRRKKERNVHILKKCQNLEKKNRKLRWTFYILAAACSIIAAIYFMALVMILAAYSKLGEDPPTTSAARLETSISKSTRPESSLPYCVSEKEIAETETEALWKNIKTDGMERINDKRCFTDLRWIPKLLKEVNASVCNFTNSLENRQKNMSETIVDVQTWRRNLYPDLFENVTLDPFNERVFFAHHTLDEIATIILRRLRTDRRSTDDLLLLWKKVSSGSSSKGIDVERLNIDGELRIETAGYYFVYSKVEFIQGAQTSEHQVVKNYGAYSTARQVLLQASGRSLSFLQGMFYLKENETVAVLASAKYLKTNNPKDIYFGVYLVRTI